MSAKGLELIQSNKNDDDSEEEEDGVQADGTFKVKSLEDMQENLPGWVYPKHPHKHPHSNP